MATVFLALTIAAAGCAARTPGVDGEPTEEERIRAAVVREFEDIEDLELEELVIEVTGGVVTLSGVQSSSEAVGEALREAAAVRGVLEVVNRVRIRSSG